MPEDYAVSTLLSFPPCVCVCVCVYEDLFWFDVAWYLAF